MSSNGGGYVPPPRPSMSLSQSFSGRTEMQQRLVMTPRVREDIDEEDEKEILARAVLPPKKTA